MRSVHITVMVPGQWTKQDWSQPSNGVRHANVRRGARIFACVMVTANERFAAVVVIAYYFAGHDLDGTSIVDYVLGSFKDSYAPAPSLDTGPLLAMYGLLAISSRTTQLLLLSENPLMADKGGTQ